MAMAIGSSRGPSSNMNVTPMIDVLLVLLVIFMVITPIAPKGEAALIPQPPAPHANLQATQQTLVLRLLDGPGVMPALEINQESVQWADLGHRLQDIFATRTEKVLFIRAADDLSWDSVARAIDIAHAAGVDKVGLVTAKTNLAGEASL